MSLGDMLLFRFNPSTRRWALRGCRVLRGTRWARPVYGCPHTRFARQIGQSAHRPRPSLGGYSKPPVFLSAMPLPQYGCPDTRFVRQIGQSAHRPHSALGGQSKPPVFLSASLQRQSQGSPPRGARDLASEASMSETARRAHMARI